MVTRIVVIGASGRTGRRVLAEAKARRLPTVAFVRDPSRLPPDHGAAVVVGDVMHPEDLHCVFRAGDAVISTLGASDPTNPGAAMSEGITNVIAAMEAVAVTRLLAVAGAGVLQHDAAHTVDEMPTYPATFRAINAEHRGMLRALEQSHLAWTLVCTPRLADGPSAGLHVRAAYLPPGSGVVTTAAVASLLVNEATNLDGGRRGRLGVNGV